MSLGSGILRRRTGAQSPEDLQTATMAQDRAANARHVTDAVRHAILFLPEPIGRGTETGSLYRASNTVSRGAS